MKKISSILIAIMMSFLYTNGWANWFQSFYYTHAHPLQWTQGIYLQQSTVENSHRLKNLIQQAQETGINTFIIDFQYMSKAYQNNIVLVKDAGIRYVARIVVFPKGGLPEQVASKDYWQQKLDLALQAVSLGADEIQLDYIRYRDSNVPSDQNSQNIYQIIKYFKNQLAFKGIPIQIDIFGITTFRESKGIGQNIQLFSHGVDAFCPMVYPSHYRFKLNDPYELISLSLEALNKQFQNYLPFKLYPFIEVSDYRHHLTPEVQYQYIQSEIQAVKNHKTNGWYAWSSGNKYQPLFDVLKNKNQIA